MQTRKNLHLNIPAHIIVFQQVQTFSWHMKCSLISYLIEIIFSNGNFGIFHECFDMCTRQFLCARWCIGCITDFIEIDFITHYNPTKCDIYSRYQHRQQVLNFILKFGIFNFNDMSERSSDTYVCRSVLLQPGWK